MREHLREQSLLAESEPHTEGAVRSASTSCTGRPVYTVQRKRLARNGSTSLVTTGKGRFNRVGHSRDLAYAVGSTEALASVVLAVQRERVETRLLQQRTRRYERRLDLDHGSGCHCSDGCRGSMSEGTCGSRIHVESVGRP